MSAPVSSPCSSAASWTDTEGNRAGELTHKPAKNCERGEHNLFEGNLLRDTLDREKQAELSLDWLARQVTEHLRQATVGFLRDIGCLGQQFVRRFGIELLIGAQELDEIGEAAIEFQRLDDGVHLGADACDLPEPQLVNLVRVLRTFMGTMSTPHTGWMLMRSLETLKLRMTTQMKTARYVADFLADLRERSGATVIHLIAHSMGNRAMIEAVVSLSPAYHADD